MNHTAPASDSNQHAAWVAFARLGRIQFIASEHGGLLDKMGYSDGDQFIEAMRNCIDASPEEVIPILMDPQKIPSISARELACAFFIARTDYFDISASEHSRYVGTVEPYIPNNSPFHSHALYLECLRSIYQDQPVDIDKIIEARTAARDPRESDVLTMWGDALVDFVRGEAAFVAGNYKVAHHAFNSALPISSGLDFHCADRIRMMLARLLRESGQPADALEIWSDPDLLTRLRYFHDYPNLAVCHLNAARCAMDEKSIPVARSLLENANEWLSIIEGHTPRLQGYRHLREGELATLEENYEEGEILLRRALDFFRSLDPPCSEGLLETKIALGSYALFQSDLRMAWAIVRSLIDEAGDHRCLPMRSRALLLQTWFFISSDPPTRLAFDNVLERIHMIQNPALMMHALGNLLSYAIQNLEETDQAHLLQRIRGLKGVLEESCYEKLYQQHVSTRFAPAMEERFDRLFTEQDKALESL